MSLRIPDAGSFERERQRAGGLRCEAADGDGVAEREAGGGGGVFVIAGEPEEAVGVGEGDPVAAGDVVEIAAVEDAVGLAVSGELEVGFRGDAGGGEIGGLGVEEGVAVNGGDFGDAGGEAGGVGVAGDLGGDGFGDDGGVEGGRAGGGGGEMVAAGVEPGGEGAEGDEALGLVEVDVAVARDAEEDGAEGGRGVRGGRCDVGGGAVEFALVGEEEEGDFGLTGGSEGGAGFFNREGGADGDGAGVEGGGAFGGEGDNEAAHGFAFEEDAGGRTVFLGDVSAKGVEVGEAVGDDEAVAAVAGLGDDPAFSEERLGGELLGEEIGDERGFGVAVAVGDEEELAVPLGGSRGMGDREFGTADLAGFERGFGGGGELSGANCEHGEGEAAQSEVHGGRFGAFVRVSNRVRVTG